MTAERGVLTFFEEDYPYCLREYRDAPDVLHYWGDLSLLNTRKVAIVGSRKCTDYGKKVAKRIARTLVGYGVTIVSGMAVGIDSIAQQAALDAGGKTISVLGTGLDVVYPAANRELRERIIEEGLMLTEYNDDIRGSRFTFPRRNRIISGIAEATIVVEAGQNSGSLITAGFSNDQGRPTFAVPGRIDSVLSLGTNQLIRDGAQPFLNVEDVLLEIGIDLKMPGEGSVELGKEEAKIIDILKAKGEVTVDTLCAELGLSAGEINGIVGVMEIKGFVATALGRVFLNL